MILKEKAYQINSFNSVELAKEYQTPVFIYDGDKIEEQILKMKNAFKGVSLRLKYACKALTNINILKIMNANGVDVDVVSIEEARLAIHAGYLPNQIQFTPSGVIFDEIIAAVDLGLNINLDSISLIEKFGEKYGNTYPVAIRLNPDILAGGNLKISTGHVDSKFGIPYAYLDEIVELVEKYNLNIIGIHQHNGSDFKNADVIIEAMKKSFLAALKYFPNLEFIDMGSGFKVPYSPTDSLTDMDVLGAKVVKEFNDFTKEYGKDIELWFEPGKFLVSESGYFLVNSNIIKPTPNRTFVHVDSGLNHLIRPMMYDAYHEIINCSNPNGTLKKYDVVGYICETDTFASDRELPEINEGDILAILNAGAYCFSMASNYNSRLRPPEVLIYKGKKHLIREREVFKDLLKGQLEVL